ncbi:MAG: T9SS type A sorting domain-containing protein [Bacteroidales bacterium]|nr:T9SS type A sorting domain-containing protein [Bacteroidales bacterium]
MKKTILLALLVLFAVNLASAQTKHTTMLETTRDTLYPEIIVEWDGDTTHFSHPRYPENGCVCVVWHYFSLSKTYSQYLWEVDEHFLPIGGNLNDPSIYAEFHTSGYLKVTVWDSIGNSGTDSIWFNIKDWTVPIDDFTMEIDSSNHAVFSGTVTPEQTFIGILRSLDTLNWLPVYGHQVTPGHWSWRDDEVHFGLDTIWNYVPWYVDSCDNELYPEMIPGMMMGTQPAPGGGWYLTMKSVMQSNKKELDGRDGEEYVYALYTVDHEGVRHPFEVDGEQVVLPTSTQAYLLPGRHPDAYYQGGIGKLTGGKDGGMEVLSYSNKVENPLPDLDNVGDLSGDGTNATGLKVWPNPNNGTFTVEGEGRLAVTNVLGQVIKETNLEGLATMELTKGFYILKLGNVALKVVVN